MLIKFTVDDYVSTDQILSLTTQQEGSSWYVGATLVGGGLHLINTLGPFSTAADAETAVAKVAAALCVLDPATLA